MSYTSIFIHCVWGTKQRTPIFLTSANRKIIFQHIYEVAHQKGILIDTIDGWKEHIHCLIALKPVQTLGDVIKQLKGESSHWYNSRGEGRLAWQEEYFATSVSVSRLDVVRNYIRSQEEHHRHKSFDEEYEKFLEGIGMAR